MNGKWRDNRKGSPSDGKLTCFLLGGEGGVKERVMQHVNNSFTLANNYDPL
jgi:hypothetical protein